MELTKFIKENEKPIMIDYNVIDILVTDVFKGDVKDGETIKVKYMEYDKKAYFKKLDKEFEF